MSRLPLKPSVVKRLFALSGNICAFPDCNEQIVNSSGTVIGEICHIEAAEINGERYNPSSNDDFRRSFDNLILFCANDHKKTNDIETYTVDVLRKYKATHESQNNNEIPNLSDKLVTKIIEKEMQQNNNNSGSGTQFNNSASHQHIENQIGTQIINQSIKENGITIDGARKVNQELKILIEQYKVKASKPDVIVIDYKNELQDKTVRDIVSVEVKFLKFRKDNGRIKADVESHEKTHNTILDESLASTQELLKGFLIKNDPEKNEELKKSLIQKGQREPAIITCDGFLINGNRRKMALENLYIEKDQDSKYQMMRVVILEDGATELEIQKIENRLQLQSEGKSEYQGLNRALTIRANENKGFTLESQLKDDPNYHDLSPKDLKKIVEDFRKKYLNPLECADRYLSLFNRQGLYNTVSEGSGDKQGRWQAFIDYSAFYHGTLTNKSKQLELGIRDNEVRKIEDSLFKIIRKRELNSKEIESSIGKVHDFIRKAPKYIKNQESKKFLLKIADEVKEDIPDEMKIDKDGDRYSDREIDEKWGNHFRQEILGNLIQAHKIVMNQETRDKPIELLEDALKKLKHENLRIENMDTSYYEKALSLTQSIVDEGSAIHKSIDDARFKLKKLKR